MTDTAALKIKIPMTLVVYDGTLIFFRQRVFVRTRGWGLLRQFVLCVTKVPKELSCPEMPEICTSKHLQLHLIHVVLGVRILLDFVYVFLRTFYASRWLNCEL